MNETPSFIEALTPFLPLLGTILGGLIVGAFAVWNRRRGAVESRAPSVAELWARQAEDAAERDAERDLRRWYQEAFFLIREAFRGYVKRVLGGGSPELKEHEREALEQKPPSIERP